MQYTGLTPPLKWAVTPDLPEGLKLDAPTGVIAGTPHSQLKKTPFTFTVTDSATPSPASSTVQLSFEVK